MNIFNNDISVFRRAGLGSAVTNLNTFKFTVDTTISGTSAANQFKIPFIGIVNCIVDWGDSNSDAITSPAQAETLHTYAAGGVYTIEISGPFGGITHIFAEDQTKITS